MKLDPNSYEPFDLALRMVYRQGSPSVILRLYRIGAKAGDALAHYALASLYIHGNEPMGVKVNAKKALVHLRAAALTQCRAMFDLGVAYALGNGVKANQRVAYKWFAKAAANGSIYAKLEVGRRKFCGEGTEKDLKLARSLERSALAQIAAFRRKRPKRANG